MLNDLNVLFIIQVSVDNMDQVISVILNKLAEKAIERLLLTGILKLGLNKKSELLQTNSL